tara:strand:+ start:376 stop:711 length:336 start_codon:yes stop_codon:yes gene_type:complete
MKKKYKNIENIRLKNNKNTIDILRLAFKFYPKESRYIMIEVNKWDKKISKILNEFSSSSRREDELILNDLERLRAENNKYWMKLYRLADSGSPVEYKKLKDKANKLTLKQK